MTDLTNNTGLTSKLPAKAPPALAPRPYRSTGERYLATAIPGLFNLTVGFVELKDFVRFQEVYESNIRCREHWPELVRHVDRADPQLFGRFDSKAALRWVLFTKGIDARGWELRRRKFSHSCNFYKVCGEGDLDIVRAMVERTQVELEKRDELGWTPLHQATWKGHLSVVQYLCEQGASKEARSDHSWTPLLYAAQYGHLAVVQYLCEQGVDEEVRDIDGQTPLNIAAWNGYLPVVQYLCERGADKEARDRFGRTPLHRAVPFPRVVEYLSSTLS